MHCRTGYFQGVSAWGNVGDVIGFYFAYFTVFIMVQWLAMDMGWSSHGVFGRDCIFATLLGHKAKLCVRDFLG